MLKRIFSYSGQYRKYLVFAALCITAESLFELVIPLIMADIVDIGVASGDRAYIFRQGGIMILAALLVFFYYDRMSRKQFGGTTGDLAGYFLQICELAMLAGAVLSRGIG